MKLKHGGGNQLRLPRVIAVTRCPLLTLGQRLFEEFVEIRFVVEQIDLAWGTSHEQKDDVLALGGEMAPAGSAMPCCGTREAKAVAPRPIPDVFRNCRRDWS